MGKAKNLANRVRSYFHSPGGLNAKTRALVESVEDISYIVADSELEALVLECNLIKEHRPRYNTMLKDDKTYPYIKVTTARIMQAAQPSEYTLWNAFIVCIDCSASGT